MTVYTFRCSKCGSFDLERPIALMGRPAPCPTCNTKAERQYIFNTTVNLRETPHATVDRQPRPDRDLGGVFGMTIDGGSIGVSVGEGVQFSLDDVRFVNQTEAGVDNRGKVRLRHVSFE